MFLYSGDFFMNDQNENTPYDEDQDFLPDEYAEDMSSEDDATDDNNAYADSDEEYSDDVNPEAFSEENTIYESDPDVDSVDTDETYGENTDRGDGTNPEEDGEDSSESEGHEESDVNSEEESQHKEEDDDNDDEWEGKKEEKITFLKRLTSTSPYMVMLVLAFLALLLGIGMMTNELSIYDWIVKPESM